jgi:RNA polymerase sigma-70 factor (ECF subfamily)
VTQSLLQRVAAGDAGAVRELIDRYGGLVWSLARRLSLSQSDAEDAVQEVFADVWKSAARFDERVASEATFIAMIARRRLIDRRRRASRTPAAVEVREDLDGATARITPERRAELTEEASKAVKAIETLRPEQQRVLRLSIYHGLSHERIAEVTGLPLGTVKTHVRRGLLAVREALGVAKDEGSIEARA